MHLINLRGFGGRRCALGPYCLPGLPARPLGVGLGFALRERRACASVFASQRLQVLLQTPFLLFKLLIARNSRAIRRSRAPTTATGRLWRTFRTAMESPSLLIPADAVKRRGYYLFSFKSI